MDEPAAYPFPCCARSPRVGERNGGRGRRGGLSSASQREERAERAVRYHSGVDERAGNLACGSCSRCRGSRGGVGNRRVGSRRGPRERLRSRRAPVLSQATADHCELAAPELPHELPHDSFLQDAADHS